MFTSNAAFVMIDMEENFRAELSPATCRMVEETNLAVAKHFIAAGKPIIQLSSYVAHPHGAVLQYGSLTQEMNALFSTPGAIVEPVLKTQQNGYEFVQASDILDTYAIDTLCIGGLFASLCVSDFAVSAHEDRKRIVSAKNLIADPCTSVLKKNMCVSALYPSGFDTLNEIGHLYGGYATMLRNM